MFYTNGMKIFFESMSEIEHFTKNLKCQEKLVCQHCLKFDQLVSHGYVYKNQHLSDDIKVGKRVLCSNRYNNSGCGHTTRLYLKGRIPKLSHGAFELFVFLSALISGLSIQKAYERAVGVPVSRQAYRWLHKLYRKLSDYRRFQDKNAQDDSLFKSRPKNLRQLLATLKQMFSQHSDCAGYHLHYQKPFI